MEPISIKFKLPRKGKKVIVYWKGHKGNKFVDIATFHKYSKSDWWFSFCDYNGDNTLDDSQVTHWCDIPKISK